MEMYPVRRWVVGSSLPTYQAMWGGGELALRAPDAN